ncbi:MAG: hypothetical protein VXW65_05295 [Pseudomonadota bacterium]|nr:hypothetical protein [Pseudomonadota bacterium]
MADGITADSLAVPEGGLSEMDAYYLIVAQHLIVDWRDVQDEEGNPIPYSVDVATKILEQNVDLWKWLLKQAGDIQQSANEQVEETVKKPLPVTAGSAKTRVRKKPKSPASG